MQSCSSRRAPSRRSCPRRCTKARSCSLVGHRRPCRARQPVRQPCMGVGIFQTTFVHEHEHDVPWCMASVGIPKNARMGTGLGWQYASVGRGRCSPALYDQQEQKNVDSHTVFAYARNPAFIPSWNTRNERLLQLQQRATSDGHRPPIQYITLWMFKNAIYAAYMQMSHIRMLSTLKYRYREHFGYYR